MINVMDAPFFCTHSTVSTVSHFHIGTNLQTIAVNFVVPFPYNDGGQKTIFVNFFHRFFQCTAFFWYDYI